MPDKGEDQNSVEGDVSRYYRDRAAPRAGARGDPRMWAAFGLFFVLAFAFASWLPRLPELKRAFGMSEGDVGFVLLAMPVAQLCVIPLVAFGSVRLRLRTLNLICITWLLVAIALVGLATSSVSLAIVVFLIGAGTGSTGVAINAAGFAAEEAMGRPILSRCHAMYSVGLAAGGLTAGLMAAADVPIIVHLTMTNIVLLAVLLVIVRAVVDTRKPEDDAPKFAWPKGALLIPGLIAMGSLMAEGVSVDWSSIYLSEVINAPTALVGAGVAAFSGAMAVMRFAGDWISERVPPRLIVAGGAVLSAAGYAITAIAPNAAVAFAGLILVGFGLAPIVPLAFRIAGKLSPNAPGIGVAAVSTLGYAGFLLGPPLVGLVAEASSLRLSLGAVSGMLILVTLISFRLSTKAAN
ncbi:MFS transporter [uncultured Roseobacter sp.]|uniref:MFS transporter n=1 Tax=uncultured Roseobacter sp. TaxID=114847 RepID=UPI00260843EF|nr:MFS transporter [uncultured Roseobacter sp.]